MSDRPIPPELSIPRWPWWLSWAAALTCLLCLGCGDGTGPTTGIRISSATTGALLDPDGYVVTLDGVAGPSVEVNGELVIPDLEPGDHSVSLSGVACNCTLAAQEPVTVTVTPGNTAEAPFAITCEEIGRLAFADGFPGDIYRIDLDGSNRTRLTEGLGARSPRWSPDGSKIAYVTEDDGFIWMMNADGSGHTRLTETATDLTPSWSPDGTRLVYAHFGEIYTIDAEGGNLRRLTEDAYADREPAWSPDGDLIVFSTNRGGSDFSNGFYTMSPDGSQITSLLEGGDYQLEAPAWSPDGDMIVYRAYFPLLSGLHIMTMDGALLPYEWYNLVDYAWDPAWSPGGSWIAYGNGHVNLIRPDRTDSLMLLTAGNYPDWAPAVLVQSPEAGVSGCRADGPS